MPEAAAATEATVVSIKPGNQTTEWKAAKIAVLIGGILQAIGGGLAAIQVASKDGLIPQNQTLSLILILAPILIGTLKQIVTLVAYMGGRADIKTAAIEAGAAAAADDPLEEINK